MARGFVYLAAVVDWFGRRVLSWRLSISMDVSFCVEAAEEALGRYGAPEVFNTDQGRQFTSMAFAQVLRDNDIAISMEAEDRGATTSSSNGSGSRSNMRRTPSPTPGPRLAAIWPSTMLDGPLKPWPTDARRRLLQRADANPGSSITKAEIHLAIPQ